jgi:proteic killer suppression protein
MAIRDYRDQRTADFVAGSHVREFESCAKPAPKAIAKLQSATRLMDLRNPPSNRFQALSGERDGEYSIRIDRRWRVCFRWAFLLDDVGTDTLARPGEPFDVEISDHYE